MSTSPVFPVSRSGVFLLQPLRNPPKGFWTCRQAGKRAGWSCTIMMPTSASYRGRPGETLSRMALGLAVMAAGASAVRAQDAVRSSMASAEAAAARRRSLNADSYSIRLDPVLMNLSGSLGTRYVSNVFLSPEDPQSDWVIQPLIKTSLLWPISAQNSLSVGLGVGYDYYVKTDSYRRFFIAPGTDISFDVYVKDFVINLHSNFLLTQDPTYNPSVSRQGSQPQFINYTGTQVDWDLNKLLLTFNYDHIVDIYTESVQSYQSYGSDQFSVRAGTRFHPALLTAIELGGGMTRYEQYLNDHTHISAGPMARWQISDNTSVRGAFGYAIYMFSPGEIFRDLPDYTGFYGSLTLQQQLTRNVSQSFSGGKRLEVNTRGFPLDTYFVNYSAILNIIRRVGLSFGIGYQNGREYSGLNERYNWVSLNLGVTHRLTRHIFTRLTVQPYWKISSRDQYDYTQYNVTFQASYRF